MDLRKTPVQAVIRMKKQRSTDRNVRRCRSLERAYAKSNSEITGGSVRRDAEHVIERVGSLPLPLAIPPIEMIADRRRGK
jgi:hypothetical protein